jgi:hypothetical protein
MSAIASTIGRASKLLIDLLRQQLGLAGVVDRRVGACGLGEGVGHGSPLAIQYPSSFTVGDAETQ